MKIAIVGASSFIGYRLFSTLQETGNLVIGTYHTNKKSPLLLKLDICSEIQIRNFIYAHKPNIIIWVAGNKNLKITEQNLLESRKINTYPLQSLISSIKLLNAYNPKIIFFSTDYVFDGNRGQYRDIDTPNPTTNYGISNYEAENILELNYNNYTILRTSAVMGKGGTFFDFLIHSLQTCEQIEVYKDIVFSPTPLQMLLDAIPHIINSPSKVLHLAGQPISRYDFAVKIKTFLKENIFSIKASILPTSFQKQQTDGYLRPNLSLSLSEELTPFTQKYNSLCWMLKELK